MSRQSGTKISSKEQTLEQITHEKIVERLVSVGLLSDAHLEELYVQAGCTRMEAKSNVKIFRSRRILNPHRIKPTLLPAAALIVSSIGLEDVEGLDFKKYHKNLSEAPLAQKAAYAALKEKGCEKWADLFSLFYADRKDPVKALRHARAIWNALFWVKTGTGLQPTTAWNDLKRITGIPEMETISVDPIPFYQAPESKEPTAIDPDYQAKLDALGQLGKVATKKEKRFFVRRKEDGEETLDKEPQEESLLKESAKEAQILLSITKEKLLPPKPVIKVTREVTRHQEFEPPKWPFVSEKNRLDALPDLRPLPSDPSLRETTAAKEKLRLSKLLKEEGIESEDDIRALYLEVIGKKPNAYTHLKEFKDKKIYIAGSTEYRKCAEILVGALDRWEEGRREFLKSRWAWTPIHYITFPVMDALVLDKREKQRIREHRRSLWSAYGLDVCSVRGPESIESARLFIQEHKPSVKEDILSAYGRASAYLIPEDFAGLKEVKSFLKSQHALLAKTEEKKKKEKSPRTPSAKPEKKEVVPVVPKNGKKASVPDGNLSVPQKEKRKKTESDVDSFLDKYEDAKKEVAVSSVKDSFAFLLQDMKKYPLLSREEEERVGEDILFHQEQLLLATISAPDALLALAEIYNSENASGVFSDRRGGEIKDTEEKEDVANRLAAISDNCACLYETVREGKGVSLEEKKQLVGKMMTFYPHEEVWKELGDVVSQDPVFKQDTHLQQSWTKHSEALSSLYEKLVLSNLRLVVNWSYKMAWGDENVVQDNITSGFIGLMKSPPRWDYRLGKFSTFATWWIRQSILREQADTLRPIRFPVHFHELSRHVAQVKKEIRTETPDAEEKEITPEQIAERLDEDPEKVAHALYWINNSIISLNAHVGGEEDADEIGDFIADEKTPSIEGKVEKEELSRTIVDVMGSLSPRQAFIVRERFWKGKTLEELGQELGVSRERIRQIEKMALNRLKHPMRSDKLRVFYEDDLPKEP